ncbi:MAG: CHAD domain-containing protein [Proteobacteria bacterium]|nr:CHAD domain-containing protein [Pseudomonadota bacterium]
MTLAHRMPVRAAPIVLNAAWTLEDALKCVVGVCLSQLHANADLAAHPRDSEFLHQTRVALRRMRSVLRLRRPQEDAVLALRAELRWLSTILGPARDWDVLIEQTLPPIVGEYAHTASAAAQADAGPDRLLGAAKRRRGAARKVAREGLASARFAAFIQSVEHWLESPPLPDLRLATLTQFASAEIGRRQKRLLRDGANLLQQTAEQRHKVRIGAKRLRYAIELFASLYPAKAVRRYLREVVALQDALGALNDAATATRLLAGLPVRSDLVAFTHGWIAAREADSAGAAELALTILADSPRFWKSPAPSGGQA